MNRIWFTADPHFFHPRILELCRRPFSDLDAMHHTLILNWNQYVQPGDRVYVVGDFSFGKREETLDLLRQLKGQKYLIQGNHDRDPEGWADPRAGFQWVKDLYELKVSDPDVQVGKYAAGKQPIVLCHYCLDTWHRSYHGTWHLYGHSHGLYQPPGRRLDVGVDVWNYRPISYEEVKAALADRPVWSPDYEAAFQFEQSGGAR